MLTAARPGSTSGGRQAALGRPLVAIDLQSGALDWFHQATPHDLFDHDLALSLLMTGTPGEVRDYCKKLIDTVVDLPTVLPPSVAGIALLLAFGRMGLLGSWLQETFGVSVAFTRTAVILAQVFVASPFYIKGAAIALAGPGPVSLGRRHVGLVHAQDG